MEERINPSHTLYSIHYELLSDQIITIGKLGTFTFHKGTYIYIGSAKRNIEARLNRHKKIDKLQKWHIDYLRPFVSISKIITYETSIGECNLAEKLRIEEGGSFPIKGFGSSDCKCTSHLVWIPK